MLVVGKAKLLQLHQTDSVPDDLLRKVRPVQAVDAIGANGAPLDLDMAQVPLALPVYIGILVVGQALAREAREEMRVLQEASHVGEQIIGEKLLVFLASLDVVVQKVDLERVGELFVEREVDKIAVLARHSLFSCVVCLSQIQAVEREGVFLEHAGEVLASRHSVLIDVLV